MLKKQQPPLIEEMDRGFLTYKRLEPLYRPISERVKDFRAVEKPLDNMTVRQQAARCMGCGVPFCHASQHGCSLGNVIPEFNELVFEGQWQEAIEILHSTNRFPEITGRVCPAPCESACVLGINDDPVSICKTELAIVEKGFKDGVIVPHPPKKRIGKKIAILGSGPAGLACADVLNQYGFSVTVYETEKKPGGILRYGIPDFKLEKWIIDRRVNLLIQEGIDFKCGIEGGTDISAERLNSLYDVIILAGGARKPRDLEIQGRELIGIHTAMDYLKQQNRLISGEPLQNPVITAKDKHVVVIGGGDTGSDCIGTAIRQGARSVTQIEILPKPPLDRSPETPWPLWPGKLRTSTSHLEGAERLWSISTLEFSGDASGKVRGLRCARVKQQRAVTGEAGAASDKGKGKDFVLDADLVLLAMGFNGFGRNSVVEKLKIKNNDRGFIERNENCMTSQVPVFVTGDMWRGASLVVHAIADGMRCAENVIDFLYDDKKADPAY